MSEACIHGRAGRSPVPAAAPITVYLQESPGPAQALALSGDDITRLQIRIPGFTDACHGAGP